MALVHRRRQHHHLACQTWLQRETSRRRRHVGKAAQRRPQAPDLHAQTRAVRLVGLARAKDALQQRLPRHIARPGFREGAGERQQHEAPCQGDRRALAAFVHDAAAGVYHQRVGRKDRFNLG